MDSDARRAALVAFFESLGETEAPVLEPAAFDGGLVGFDHAGRRLVYDRDRLAAALVEAGEAETVEDAYEWISYNTERSLPYMGPQAPVLVDVIDGVTSGVVRPAEERDLLAAALGSLKTALAALRDLDALPSDDGWRDLAALALSETEDAWKALSAAAEGDE